MSRGAVVVQPTVTGRWGIVIDGKYRTQADAEAQARIIARLLRVELVIRGLSGRILRRDSHGSDPRNIPG